MKKAELISAIAEKSNVPKYDVDKVLTSLGEVVLENVKDGDITIPKLGSFKLRTNKARDGRNPATNKPMKIKASVGVAFKQSSSAKKAING